MDMTAIGVKVKDLGKKYKYVLLILAVGIGLMLIPSGKKETQSSTEKVKNTIFVDKSI